MLPHVHGEQRGLAMRHRQVGVRRLGDLQLAAVQHQPGPAAAELRRAGGLERLDELVVATEVGIDLGRDLAGGLAAAARP